jgi:hypothetical protein
VQWKTDKKLKNNMKANGIFLKKASRVTFMVVLIGLLYARLLNAQSWYDANWQYRSAITVPPVASPLSDYQVQIKLNVGNFDFAKSLSPGGNDIRVTDIDGTTLIPFWIESWTTGNASIWVKVPDIPTAGTTIYLYYGNASPTVPTLPAVETPPIGPFTRSSDNPIKPIPFVDGIQNYKIAENIVYDAVTSHYWMVLADDGYATINLMWSDTPADPAKWNWYSGNPVIYNANAPHLIQDGTTWYIFYADRSIPSPWPISVRSSTAGIEGPYLNPATVLNPGLAGSWDDFRVDEPYVLKIGSTWYMVFMGDAGDTHEQVGYATANSITGPYTEYSGSPVLAFGDSYDHGTIADPWVYNYHNTYYIGYTVSGKEYGQSPWKTAVATTTDWVNFSKHGVIFPTAESEAEWDHWNSFRGAVTLIGSTYVLSYTGGGSGSGIPYQMGIATQPVYMSPPTGINDPDAVFDFYDSFDGSGLDASKWTVMNKEDQRQPYSSGGLLTLNSGTFKTRIFANTSFGMNYIEETRARHLNQGINSMIMQVGFVSFDFRYITRILDDEGDVIHWQRLAYNYDTYNPNISMSQNADADWHIFHVFRQGTGTAGFQIDDNPTETVNENVPTINLPPYLDSYGYDNNVIVDWFRIRKWAGSDLVTVVGPGLLNGQNLLEWTGALTTDWNTTGNWNPNSLPGSTDYITIPDVANDPVSGDLTIGSSSSLEIQSGGALTVNGNLANNGLLTIESSSVNSSGSLIVNGTSTGTVTYNRQMRTEANDGDYHYFSSPVASNTATNSTKVNAVWQWNEVTGGWSTLNMTQLKSGIGYNVDQTPESDGLISFTGSVITSSVTIDATSPYNDEINGTETNYDSRTYVQGDGHSGTTPRSLSNYGGGGWNMLGNPYTSSILVSDFIAANSAQFDPNYVAVYLYDGTSPGHTRYYYIGNSTGWGDPISQTHIQVGQGFFVLAMNDYSTFTFDKDMQHHNTVAAMLKSGGAKDRWPGLQLKVKSGENENQTTIVFNESMTEGLDPGYDVGLMSYGPGAGIYTALVKDNGVNFTRQALPVNGSVKNIIPVGIDFENGGEVTFSADIEPFRNYKFWLEDRTTGIVTELGANTYTVTLPARTYGTGRFFVYVAAGRSIRPRTDNANLLDIRIWSTQDRQINIQGVVSEKATCEVYDTFGKKIFDTRLTDGDYNSFNIPSADKGVYLVKVTDGLKVITGRVVLLK